MIGKEHCPCGHSSCKKWFLVGIGDFVQGSGFTEEEADRIINALNASHSTPAGEDVEPWWLNGWSYDLDAIPSGFVEVAFDSGRGLCSIYVCEQIITSPGLVNDRPVPKSERVYGYRDADGREIMSRRAYAWRPVPAPPPPSQGQWPSQDEADADAERTIATYGMLHVREYIARKISAAPSTHDELVEALEATLELLNSEIWTPEHVNRVGEQVSAALTNMGEDKSTQYKEQDNG